MASHTTHWWRRFRKRLPGRRAGSVESAAVMQLLAACNKAGVPPETILAAWAEECRPAQAARVERLAAAIGRGETVATAIAATAGVVCEDDAVAIRFGDRMGLLEAMAAKSAAGVARPAAARNIGSSLAFVGVVLACFLVISTFVAVKILPQFETILADSGLPRPAALQRWLDLWGLVSRFLWLLPVALLAGLVAAVVPWLRRLALAPLARPGRITAALDALVVAMKAGTSPSAAADMLAGCQTDRRVAAMLSRMPGEGRLGTRLAAAGIVSPIEAQEIDGTAGDAADALAAVADRRRERGRMWATAWNTTFVPLAVVAIGVLVLLQSLAIFVPLIDMIHGLAEGIS